MIDEYEHDLEWFIEKLTLYRNIRRDEKTLELADIMAITNLSVVSQKGATAFTKWFRGKQLQIQDNRESENETLFQKLKRKARNKLTLFDKLKG